MILRIHSGTSYLSESTAGSRLGALEYLGSEGDKDQTASNGLVNVISCRSNVIVSSGEAVETQQTLAGMGFPQPVTIIKSVPFQRNGQAKIQSHGHAVPLDQGSCPPGAVHPALGTR